MSDVARPLRLVAIALLAAVALYVGWKTMFFLCDDAFIEYRYVWNHMVGRGWVWNPPPFRPVEGYTSFLWVVLLEVVWRATAVEPPESAPAISLVASYGTVLVTMWTALRMPLSERLAPWRDVVVGLVLVGTLTNRTFLTWTSSGLEAGLFSFLLVSWVAVGVTLSDRARLWGLLALSAVLELCRPDGQLFVLASVAAGLLHVVRRRREGKLAAVDVLPLLFVASPVAHVLWRHATYGAWQPNTYYAKYVGPWPLAGSAYVAAFLLEYAGWLPLGMLAVVLWRARSWRPPAAWSERLDLAERAVPVAAVAAHWAYYTFVIGGDHFEWRIYHHLVPLGFLGAVWAADRVAKDARRALGLVGLCIVLSWPVPWLHFAYTDGLHSRQQTHLLVFPLSEHVPWPFKLYTLAFDGLESFLVVHHDGNRQEEHRAFWELQDRSFPTREDGLKTPWNPDDVPVYAQWSIGVPGWVMPNVAVIDKLGLNDAVVARTPVPPDKERTMAHDRRPPPGYVECFRPNVEVKKGQLVVKPRKEPLTADDARACEDRFLEQVAP